MSKCTIMEKIRLRLVYNRRKRLNVQGKALIQIEASLDKRKVYFSTRVYIRPEEWEQRTSTIIGHPHAYELNALLYEQMLQLEALELSMWKRGVTPTLLQLKEAVLNKRGAVMSFEAFSRSVINQSNRRQGTKTNLYSTLTLLAAFHPDYAWDDLTYTFLKGFEAWLLKRNLAVNTVAKHLRNLRTLVNEAVSAGYMQANEHPFRHFSIKNEQVPHRFLNPEELRLVEQAAIKGKLAHVRDAFLFCCYTGLRFSDFKLLCDDSFTEIMGETWLVVQCQKTGSHLRIPLFLIFEGRAVEILRSYPSVSEFIQIGSNAEVNRHLSVLQELTGIKTRMTFHTARHTCATLLCHQGIPVTTVQKILGHTKLATTQIYMEVMADTMVRDLSEVWGKERKQTEKTTGSIL